MAKSKLTPQEITTVNTVIELLDDLCKLMAARIGEQIDGQARAQRVQELKLSMKQRVAWLVEVNQ